MADKEQTPPPLASTANDTTSSRLTPNPKRAKMSSPDRTVEKPEKDSKIEQNDGAKKVVNEEKSEEKREDEKQPGSTVSLTDPELNVTPTELFAEKDDLEADDGYADSAFGGSEDSDTTSVTSSITQGVIENGRRYQTKREGEYWAPADEKQFLSMEAAHIVCLLLENARDNSHFLSPIPDTVHHILDIGTGSGVWAKEVADMLPSAVVLGVDLSPPPQSWVPPNCKLEVDDVLKPWNFGNTFEFIHMRDLYGAFSNEEWRLVYKQAYNNLAPGGWIEQTELEVVWRSDDGTLPADSLLAQFPKICNPAHEKMGKPIDTFHHMRSRIETAGFTNVHEKLYKVPVGDWVKDPILKEAGRFAKSHFLGGLEGYVLFALTRFGEPRPWAPKEVLVFVATVKQEVNNPDIHAYYLRKRVWAQKPYDTKPKNESKVEVDNLA